MSNLLHSYASWVRANPENAMSLQRLTRTFALFTLDPQNLVGCELSWTLVELHAFSNQMILDTAGRRVGLSERMAILSKAISHLECLVELLLRRHVGHGAAWGGLLALQSVKCLVDFLVHRRHVLVPWIFAGAIRWIRVTLRLLRHIIRFAWPTAMQSRGISQRRREMGEREFGSTSAPLVIPRVATGRAVAFAGDTDKDNDEDTPNDAVESVPCTFLDVLALAVDIVMLLRPLLILSCARRAFPRAPGGGDRPVVPVSPRGSKSESDCGLFLMEAALREGASAVSLMPSWRAWVSIAGLDALLAMIARYIRRHRVPVVYIPSAAEERERERAEEEEEEREEEGEAVNGGERMSAGQETNGPAGHNEHAGVQQNVTTAHKGAVESRDSWRAQQALRNCALSFLRDPFFPAVLQKPLYDALVTGRISRIPILGALVRYQVAYFLCKQHYAFMYSLGM